MKAQNSQQALNSPVIVTLMLCPKNMGNVIPKCLQKLIQVIFIALLLIGWGCSNGSYHFCVDFINSCKVGTFFIVITIT